MNTCRICWKEIWKTYSDKKLRCSSCRKSVENAIWYNERTVEYVEDELFAWKEEYKKLKKENKKLNIKVASLEWEIKWLNSVIDKLKEENQTLELWLDNKEKLNEKYRKEIEECEYNYKTPYNEMIPRDENWFYKEVKPTC